MQVFLTTDRRYVGEWSIGLRLGPGGWLGDSALVELGLPLFEQFGIRPQDGRRSLGVEALAVSEYLFVVRLVIFVHHS